MIPNIKEWEKVLMFRCIQDPMIGPKPRNAFMLPDLPDWEAWLHIPSGTVHVKTSHGRRHVVGMGNWSSIELEKEKDGQIQNTGRATTEATDTQTRGPGRPRKELLG